MARTAPLTEKNLLSLLSYLTLRVLFTGSGRVGTAQALINPQVAPVEFQISQRADYIENDFYEWVQHNRAIINTRDEPLADARKYRRLHLIHSDTHVLPSALYLKVGATRLVLDLLEADALPVQALADAVGTLRTLSHQPQPPWRVQLVDGSEEDPVQLLAQFRQQAQKRFAGRDAETDAVLALWTRVEAGLTENLDGLVGVVDWVTKRHLLEAFRESENLAWNDPWLEAQDLEYHHIDPARSLGLMIANREGPWGDADGDDSGALERGPSDTRAGRRGALLRRLGAGDDYCEVDWDRIDLLNGVSISMSDPFQSAEASDLPGDRR